MSRKTALNYTERQHLQYLTSHLRSSASPAVKARYERQIDELIADKELTRSDYALASYYLGNSGTDGAESQQLSQAFAHAYRSTPAE